MYVQMLHIEGLVIWFVENCHNFNLIDFVMYKMRATLGLSEGDIWISRDYDFGTYTHTLVGKPD